MILLGKCEERLKELEENSVDAVICDPPYGLKFMNKGWDYDVPKKEMWLQVSRVLKPGGHLLSFGGARTYHRLVLAIEDAGFEIRDQLQWLYGSGFPKSLDVSKAIDKKFGAKREVIGEKDVGPDMRGGNFENAEGRMVAKVTRAATPEAYRYKGWGTALKPANEPIVLARKPLEKGLTVAENMLKWGVGGLNIDESRIASPDVDLMAVQRCTAEQDGHTVTLNIPGHEQPMYHAQGRWPSNVLLGCDCEGEEHGQMCAVHLLDEQSGTLKSGNLSPHHKIKARENISKGKETDRVRDQEFGGDSGGASRFFYVAKASKRERSNGLDKHNWFKVETRQCKDANTAAVQLLQKVISESTVKWSIDESGKSITALFPKECRSIIVTEINKITESKTLSSLIHYLINENTQDASSSMANGLSLVGSAASLKTWLMDITNGSAVSALGASLAANTTLQSISENEDPKDFNNFHATVKPIKLMEYLIKLITPPGGVVLDPFMGSGSTGVAAFKNGFKFIGIEMSEEYCSIAEKRIAHAKGEPA